MIPLSSPRDRQRYSSPVLAAHPVVLEISDEEEGSDVRLKSSSPIDVIRNLPRRVVREWRKLKRKVELPHKWRAFTPLIVLAALTMLLALILLMFASPILHWLEALGIRVRSMGFGGYILCYAMVFITCFPPMVGFSTSVMFTGFALGFPMGFFPAYLGSLSGATACFLLARRWFQDYVKRTVTSNPSLRAVIKAVEEKGFKLLLLIRLAPYPFTISNVMFSGTRVRTRDFVIATGISLLKTTGHVYIGSNLESFVTKTNANGSDDEATQASRSHELVMMIGGGGLGLGIGIYLFFVARRAVRQALVEGEDEYAVELVGGVTRDGDSDIPDLERGEGMARVGMDSALYHSPFRLKDWKNHVEGRFRPNQSFEALLPDDPDTVDSADLSDGTRMVSPR